MFFCDVYFQAQCDFLCIEFHFIALFEMSASFQRLFLIQAQCVCPCLSIFLFEHLKGIFQHVIYLTQHSVLALGYYFFILSLFVYVIALQILAFLFLRIQCLFCLIKHSVLVQGQDIFYQICLFMLQHCWSLEHFILAHLVLAFFVCVFFYSGACLDFWASSNYCPSCSRGSFCLEKSGLKTIQALWHSIFQQLCSKAG